MSNIEKKKGVLPGEHALGLPYAVHGAGTETGPVEA